MTEYARPSVQAAGMKSERNTPGSLYGISEEFWLTENEIQKKLRHRLRNRLAGNGFGFHLSDVNGIAFAIDTGAGALRSNGNYIGYER